MQDLATSSSASTELAASAQAKLQEAEEKLAGAEEAAKLAAEASQQAAKEKVALEEKVSDLQGELGEELLYQGVLEERLKQKEADLAALQKRNQEAIGDKNKKIAELNADLTATKNSAQANEEKIARLEGQLGATEQLEQKVSDLQGELGEELLYQGVLEIGKKKLANELLRINDIHQVQNEEVQKLRAENQHKQKEIEKFIQAGRKPPSQKANESNVEQEWVLIDVKGVPNGERDSSCL